LKRNHVTRQQDPQILLLSPFVFTPRGITL